MSLLFDYDGLLLGLLLVYYGDDFIGFIDVMEVMSVVGLFMVLFLWMFDVLLLVCFFEVCCIGIVGVLCGCLLQWMDEYFFVFFVVLVLLCVLLMQYKVCLIFDFLLVIGFIGCVIDLGVCYMVGDFFFMIVGVLWLRCYQVFGNLFVVVDGEGYWFDCYFIMVCYFVMFMDEVDLCCYLWYQMVCCIELVDMLQLCEGGQVVYVCLFFLCGKDVLVVLIDVFDEEILCEVG